MNLDELKDIIGRLDAGIPRENAKVSFQKYGCGDGDLEEAFIVATENGYLRMGVEFLKAGITPHLSPRGGRPFAIAVDLDYLFAENSDVYFDYFERREEIQVRTYEETWVDKFIPLAASGVILAVLALAIVGLVTIIKALF